MEIYDTRYGNRRPGSNLGDSMADNNLKTEDQKLLVAYSKAFTEDLNPLTDRIELHIYDGVGNYIKSIYNLESTFKNILQWELFDVVPEETGEEEIGDEEILA